MKYFERNHFNFLAGPICQLPRSPGQGQSSIQRWFYDAQQHLCLQFTYMGTKGNENNFLSESDCAALCPGKKLKKNLRKKTKSD